MVQVAARTAARTRAEAGAVAIVVAIMATVMFGMAALVVDLGQARDSRRQAQNAADASALAAVNALAEGKSVTDAIDQAEAYAEDNFGVLETADGDQSGWDNCTDVNRPADFKIIAGETACISFDDLAKPTKVRVVIPHRTVDTPFASVLGTSKVDVAALAEASIQLETVHLCGFCVLGPGLHDMGTTNTFVVDTDVAMNGSMSAKKQFKVTNGSLSVTDGIDKFGDASNVQPWPVTTGMTVEDPLADMAMPDYVAAGLTNQGTNNPCSKGPGIYSNFNNVSGTCNLQAGLYVITGETKITGNNTVINGDGVTLYFTCGTSDKPTQCTSSSPAWTFDMGSDKNHLNIKAATSNPQKGALANVAIVADRDWAGTLLFQGGGAGGTSGTWYLKSGTVRYGGNADGVQDGMIVVKDFGGNGNSASANFTNTNGTPTKTVPGSIHLIR